MKRKREEIYIEPINKDGKIRWDVGEEGRGGIIFSSEKLAHIYFKLLEIEKRIREKRLYFLVYDDFESGKYEEIKTSDRRVITSKTDPPIKDICERLDKKKIVLQYQVFDYSNLNNLLTTKLYLEYLNM